MLIAASLLEQTTPIFFAEFVLAGFGFFGVINFFRHNNVKAQLAAKDAVIETNQQTIEAFEDRLNSLDEKVAALETDLASANDKNKSLTEELRDWENKYKHLENFAAPALGERLIQMFERQESVLDKIVIALEGIQNRIDALESKSN